MCWRSPEFLLCLLPTDVQRGMAPKNLRNLAGGVSILMTFHLQLGKCFAARACLLTCVARDLTSHRVTGGTISLKLLSVGPQIVI